MKTTLETLLLATLFAMCIALAHAQQRREAGAPGRIERPLDITPSASRRCRLAWRKHAAAVPAADHDAARRAFMSRCLRAQ